MPLLVEKLAVQNWLTFMLLLTNSHCAAPASGFVLRYRPPPVPIQRLPLASNTIVRVSDAGAEFATVSPVFVIDDHCVELPLLLPNGLVKRLPEYTWSVYVDGPFAALT